MFASNLTNFLGGAESQPVGNQEAVGDALISFEQVLAEAVPPIQSKDSSELLLTGIFDNVTDLKQHDVHSPVGDLVLFSSESAETFGPMSTELQSSVDGDVVSASSHADLVLAASKNSAVAIAPSLDLGSRTRTETADPQLTVGRKKRASLLANKFVASGDEQRGERIDPQLGGLQNVLRNSQVDAVAQALVASPRQAQTDGTSNAGTPDEALPATEVEQALTRKLAPDGQLHHDSYDAANGTDTALHDQSTIPRAASALSRETSRELPADVKTSSQYEQDSTTRDRIAAVPNRDEVTRDASGTSIEARPVDTKPQIHRTFDHEAGLTYRSADAAVESVDATDSAIHEKSTDAHNVQVLYPHKEAKDELAEVTALDHHSDPTVDRVASEHQHAARSDADLPVAAYGNAETIEGTPRQASLRADSTVSQTVEVEQQKLIEAELDETTDQVDSVNQALPSDSEGEFDTTDQQSDHPLFQQELFGSENDTRATRDRYEPTIVPRTTPDSRVQGVSPVSTNVTNETAPTSAPMQTRDSISRPIDVTQQVTSAVMEVMESSDGSAVKTVQLELHPAELGRLKIQIEQTAESIATHIIASELVSSDLLTSKKDTLLAALSELGFGEASVDISHGKNEQSDSQPNSQRDGLRMMTTTKASESSNQAVNVSTSTGLNIVV